MNDLLVATDMSRNIVLIRKSYGILFLIVRFQHQPHTKPGVQVQRNRFIKEPPRIVDTHQNTCANIFKNFESISKVQAPVRRHKEIPIIRVYKYKVPPQESILPGDLAPKICVPLHQKMFQKKESANIRVSNMCN